MKYTVSRMDILTRKSYPIDELFRLTITDDGLVLDLDSSRKGRGLYLHKDKNTIETAKKKKLLLRYLKDEEKLNQLIEEMLTNC